MEFRLTVGSHFNGGKKKFTLIFIAIFILFFNLSCKKTEYTVQAITFPEGSKVHKNDWNYMIKVIVTSNHTPVTDQSKKIVKLEILDRSENVLFNKHYNFFCSSIKATAKWDKFDSINLELSEVGNSFAKDEYNQKLIDSGPVTLAELFLQYDDTNKNFSDRSLLE